MKELNSYFRHFINFSCVFCSNTSKILSHFSDSVFSKEYTGSIFSVFRSRATVLVLVPRFSAFYTSLTKCSLIAVLAVSIISVGRAGGTKEEENVHFEGGSRERQIYLAESGDRFAQNAMGHMYSHGKGGFPQDYTQALLWYKRAALQGLPRAQVSMGVMYRDGLGVVQNKEEALRWLRMAAAADYPASDLIDMIEDPMDPDERERLAVEDLKKQAHEGESYAQSMLGYAYFLGEGVKKDKILAHAWLTLSLEGGKFEANEVRSVNELLSVIEKKMTKRQKQKSVDLVVELRS